MICYFIFVSCHVCDVAWEENLLNRHVHSYNWQEPGVKSELVMGQNERLSEWLRNRASDWEIEQANEQLSDWASEWASSCFFSALIIHFSIAVWFTILYVSVAWLAYDFMLLSVCENWLFFLASSSECKCRSSEKVSCDLSIHVQAKCFYEILM